MAVLYAYLCATCDNHREQLFTMGKAPATLPCNGCLQPMGRDFSSVRFVSDDPIRRAYLSSQLESNLVAQQRPLLPDTPTDKFEAAHIGKAKGRVYIGDDAGALKPRERKAVSGF